VVLDAAEPLADTTADAVEPLLLATELFPLPMIGEEEEEDDDGEEDEDEMAAIRDDWTCREGKAPGEAVEHI